MFTKDNFDLDHGILYELILSDNVPKTGLFRVSETKVRSWD
jgi:hypothetical protein